MLMKKLELCCSTVSFPGEDKGILQGFFFPPNYPGNVLVLKG